MWEVKPWSGSLPPTFRTLTVVWDSRGKHFASVSLSLRLLSWRLVSRWHLAGSDANSTSARPAHRPLNFPMRYRLWPVLYAHIIIFCVNSSHNLLVNWVCFFKFLFHTSLLLLLHHFLRCFFPQNIISCKLIFPRSLTSIGCFINSPTASAFTTCRPQSRKEYLNEKRTNADLHLPHPSFSGGASSQPVLSHVSLVSGLTVVRSSFIESLGSVQWGGSGL